MCVNVIDLILHSQYVCIYKQKNAIDPFSIIQLVGLLMRNAEKNCVENALNIHCHLHYIEVGFAMQIGMYSFESIQFYGHFLCSL